MKPKKTAPSRRRVSFAVDRAEIEINSDWVQAVMASPAPPVGPAENTDASGAVFFAPRLKTATGEKAAPGEPSAPVEEIIPAEKINAVEQSAPGEDQATVENPPPVAVLASDENLATVEQTATAAQIATVEELTPVALFAMPARSDASLSNGADVGHNPATGTNTATAPDLAPGEDIATGEPSATVFNSATGPEFATEPAAPPAVRRQRRPRPIRRITDGLTPGQYAVYSLMYEAGTAEQASPEAGSRIYRGGYADLCRLTGLSKRGIQNIVGELQQKQVVHIHQAPGYHRTETTAYRLPSAVAVVQGWAARGFRYAAGKSKTLIGSAERS